MRASTLHLGEPASVDPELTVSVFRCLSFPIPKGGGGGFARSKQVSMTALTSLNF